MPTINPALVPTIDPGNIFYRFTTDDTLNVRWITPGDPCIYESVNRPMADIVLRQLIIAKALDNIELRLGHMTLFPFLVPPYVTVGIGNIEIPLSWIWDMHVSVPSKWEYMRLAKIKRISGSNGSGTAGSITGSLRLVFTAQQKGSAVEVALFTVDYKIDSPLTYQVLRVVASTSLEEAISIDPSEADTVGGFVTFRTLDESDPINANFLISLAPPVTPVDSNGDGIFDNPAAYEMAVNLPNSFLPGPINHGSGMLVTSASNAIPAMESDFSSWLSASNYPFRIGCSRTSVEGIQVPAAIFNEFDIVVPASDEPTGDATLLHSPVWLSSIVRVDTLATTLQFIFSTHSIKDDSSVPEVVPFASLTLGRGYTAGQVVAIEEIANLQKATGIDSDNFKQMFGAGHVVLSSLWGSTTTEISNFFDLFLALVGGNAATFNKSSALIQSFALSRNSRYIPTKGESEALAGTTGRWITPQNPSDSNRYVVEADQGLGDAINFSDKGFPDNVDIENIGHAGSLVHRLIKLDIDASGSNHDYATDILPRLICLLGRPPIFGDMLFDGTEFKIYDQDIGAWISI